MVQRPLTAGFVLAMDLMPAAPAESLPGFCCGGAPLGPACRGYGTQGAVNPPRTWGKGSGTAADNGSFSTNTKIPYLNPFF